MRASSVPTLYADCLNKRSCNFCLRGSAFSVDFAILRSHSCSARWSQKWDHESAFLLFFYLAVHAVPKMGPPGGPIFGTVFRFIF